MKKTTVKDARENKGAAQKGAADSTKEDEMATHDSIELTVAAYKDRTGSNRGKDLSAQRRKRAQTHREKGTAESTTEKAQSGTQDE